MSFFRYAAAAFAIVENANQIEQLPSSAREIAQRLNELNADLDVEEKLTAYRQTLKAAEDIPNRRSGYFLLVLRPEAPTLEIKAFSKRNLKRAYEEYLKQERETSYG